MLLKLSRFDVRRIWRRVSLIAAMYEPSGEGTGGCVAEEYQQSIRPDSLQTYRTSKRATGLQYVVHLALLVLQDERTTFASPQNKRQDQSKQSRRVSPRSSILFASAAFPSRKPT